MTYVCSTLLKYTHRTQYGITGSQVSVPYCLSGTVRKCIDRKFKTFFLFSLIVGIDSATWHAYILIYEFLYIIVGTLYGGSCIIIIIIQLETLTGIVYVLRRIGKLEISNWRDNGSPRSRHSVSQMSAIGLHVTGSGLSAVLNAAIVSN